MKKLVAQVLVIIFFGVGAYAIPVHADSTSLIVDGKVVHGDVHPQLVNSRVQVPLRVISENLGYQVQWNNHNQQVTVRNGQTTLVLKIGDATAQCNGNAVQLDTKPYISAGRTYVPIRFVAESFGKKVEWNQANNLAIIGTYYDGTTIENAFEYKSSLGFTVMIPRNLKNKIFFEENGGSVVLYEINEYNKSKGKTGRVLTITKSKNPGIVLIVPGYVLDMNQGTYLTAAYASDVQAFGNTMTSYLAIVKDSRVFLKTAKM